MKLVFEFGFDDRAADEAEARGYLSHVKAVSEDGHAYSLLFYDPVRLAQDIDAEASEGRPFIGEAGLIVLSKVTLANMKLAVDNLAKTDFFKRLTPS